MRIGGLLAFDFRDLIRFKEKSLFIGCCMTIVDRSSAAFFVIFNDYFQKQLIEQLQFFLRLFI